MDRPRLNVLLVAASRLDAEFASRVIADYGDRAEIARDVNDALGRLVHERFEIAIVSLSLPRGDGLALVHHLRALHPDVDVLVMAHPTEVEDISHAMALGVHGSIVHPLTGDAILVAIDRSRERRVLVAERHRLAREEASSRRRNATYARCAAFVAETEASALAARVLDACVDELSATDGAIWVPEGLGSSRFRRTAVRGAGDRFPTELRPDSANTVDPTRAIAREPGRVRIVLLGHADLSAIVDVVVPGDAPLDEARVEALDLVAALGSAAFATARKVDAIARAGIKDPETSAYTFAYFGDVAGREIDRASRHGRRFALLTLALDGLDEIRAGLSEDELVDLRRAVTDAVLESVRDSDVLARVEDDELFLLLPETGLLGALGCRRRILSRVTASASIVRLASKGPVTPIVGIGVYPTDGGNLGRLLTTGRRRADRSRRGVWRRLGLGTAPFWETVDRLLGTEDDAGIGRDGSIALHADLRAAHDEHAIARHAAVSSALVAQVAGTIAADAVSRSVAGTMYVAGDPAVATAVARAVDATERPSLRAWVLGRDPGKGPAARIHLPFHDARLEGRVLVLSLTELGGYVLVARRVSADTLLAYHASDLDLVDGLVTSLQGSYHLQPEVR